MGRARGEEGGGGWSGDRGREQRLSQGPAPYRHAAAPEASHRGGRPHRKRETERSRDVGEKGIGEGERERTRRSRRGREREDEEEEEERRCRRAALAPAPVSASGGRVRERPRERTGQRRWEARERKGVR